MLSPNEVAELTDKVKATAQAKELTHMGIPFRYRRDGSLAVLRIHVETITDTASKKPRPRVRFDS